MPNRILSRTVVIDGTLLRKVRLAHRPRLSQATLAMAADVSQASISNYETNPNAIIDSRIAEALARRLGISVHDLIITEP